jgi:carbamoyltransferase
MVLNTSFNENEPVVCEPSEALDCFLRTKMDVLVLGDNVIMRHGDNRLIESAAAAAALSGA